MVIGALCRRLGLRQRVTATACVYCKRFYCANAYAATDPMLVIAACVYLAAKADETPVRIRPFCTETAKLFAEMGFDDFADDIHVLAEMEFYLLEELDCDLVVFHPYATLAALARAPDTPLDGNTLQMAWLVVNDMYRTELPLQYPPYVLAVASVYLALVLQPQSAQTLRAGLAARASPPAGSESPPPVPADDGEQWRRSDRLHRSGSRSAGCLEGQPRIRHRAAVVGRRCFGRRRLDPGKGSDLLPGAQSW